MSTTQYLRQNHPALLTKQKFDHLVFDIKNKKIYSCVYQRAAFILYNEDKSQFIEYRKDVGLRLAVDEETRSIGVLNFHTLEFSTTFKSKSGETLPIAFTKPLQC
jgi:hypothetical protein